MKESRFIPRRAALGLRQTEGDPPVSQVRRRMGLRRRVMARGVRQFGQR